MWRIAGSGDRPPTQPQEFRIENGEFEETAAWILADSTPQLEDDGSTTYHGYWLDITVRRETQTRFAAVFEHATASYLFFDSKRGVTHCNPATLAMFGTSTPMCCSGASHGFRAFRRNCRRMAGRVASRHSKTCDSTRAPSSACAPSGSASSAPTEAASTPR